MSDISHKEVIELINLFGLRVDLDRWNEEGKGWIRVKSDDWGEEFGYPGRYNSLILYKDDGREIVIDELRQSLIVVGENIKAKKIRKELNIE